MVLKIYNTLGREKQEFKPLKDGKVTFYYCGPTVYSQQHIGNLRGVFCADSIRRSFEYLGYNVNFVSNYTDVGHLTSDGDGGEDKMEKGSKKEGLSPAEITSKYIKIYEQDANDLNITSPTTRCLATNYISEIIDMVQTLLNKGFAYTTDLAIYFDTSKLENYTQLSGQKIEDLMAGAGTGTVNDKQKKQSTDFVIWFFKAGKHKNALQNWPSPFQSPLVENGDGFPGWHIECSAMAKKHLGDTIDVHMGGIEHIPTHHTNEIAQSESANDKKYVNYWLHNEHLGFDGGKMSKSLGNVVFLEEVKKKGFNSLALRFLFSQTHYRSKQNFTWEALEAAQNGLDHLYNQISELGEGIGEVSKDYQEKFKEKIGDDFNLPQSLVIVQELLKSGISNEDKLATILDFDKVLGLKLKENNGSHQELEFGKLPEDIQSFIKERDQARVDKNWIKSDELRDIIQNLGYLIKDSESGTQIFKG